MQNDIVLEKLFELFGKRFTYQEKFINDPHGTGMVFKREFFVREDVNIELSRGPDKELLINCDNEEVPLSEFVVDYDSFAIDKVTLIKIINKIEVGHVALTYFLLADMI